MNVKLRGSIYCIVRRVPRRFASVEERKTVWISLKTDSLSLAMEKAPSVWATMLDSWEARLAGDTVEAEKQFSAAQNLARSRGFRYLEMPKVAELPLEELLKRVEAIPVVQGSPDTFEAKALLGAVAAPEISVSQALEMYWSLARDRTLGKDADQIRRWKNPRKKAVKNFIAVAGDVAISEITRDDLLDFREMWIERIEMGEVTQNSANKDFTHLGDILKTVNEKKRLKIDLPLSGLSLKEPERRSRPSFSDDWIRNRILSEGALSGLNTEARCILLGMINTGYRPSEAANLDRARIHLEGSVPYIEIAPVGRHLKNNASKRTIPLVGVSLEAFQECPNGFPSYKGKASLSNTVNKYLRSNGLMESDRHVMYSLRHAFEDRMIAAEVDNRIRRDLFGHALQEQRYGDGASLEHKARILQEISFF